MSQPPAGGTVRRSSSKPRSGRRLDDPRDDVLAAVLIRMWTLASGRTLRRDVPPSQLSAEELIAFWADDMTPRAGRHARADRPDKGGGAQTAATNTAGVGGVSVLSPQWSPAGVRFST